MVAINWDTETRLQEDLCTKKQASYIFSLAQRALGQDFELEDLTGFTSNEGVPDEEFVGLEAKVFCGNLTKRNATKVINVLQELAGVANRP